MVKSNHNEKGSITPSVRREHMLALIRESQFARVEDLSHKFGISVVTVRGDLDALARDRKLRRVHGGAVFDGYRDWSITYDARARDRLEEKRLIARDAAKLISDHESVLLDGGSTTMEIARALATRRDLKNVVIATNGVNIAVELEDAGSRFEILLTGGTLRHGQHTLTDPMAGLIIRELKATTLFLGCNGIDANGNITTPILAEREMKRLMLSAAQRRVLVADSSKFGNTSLARVCDVGDVDLILTAGEPDASIIEIIESRGVEIRVLQAGDG